MNSNTRHAATRGGRIAATLTAAMTLALVLAGCADTAPAGPTLVTTKSSTQLLAGEAVSRLSAFLNSSGKTYEDLSEACGDEAADPEGLQRLWRSSATVTLKKGVTLTSEDVIDTLATTFVNDGWVNQNTSKTDSLQLSNGKSKSTLRFTALPAVEGSTGSLLIEARGACVTTDGPDSDEVMKLENRTR